MDPRHLPPDFREFLECLNAAGVEYLLIGGHAVAFHGYPRVTSDMDVWINGTPENAEKVLAAVRSFFGANVKFLSAFIVSCSHGYSKPHRSHHHAAGHAACH